MVELTDCNIKLDHSLGCPDDCPNWRLVPGFPIYGVGQPTQDGFNKIIERISKEKLVWFNTRQEPVAYINGQPVTPRNKKNPHWNLAIGGEVTNMDKLEEEFVKQVEARAIEEGGNIEINRDKEDRENPLDREEVMDVVQVEGTVKGFNQILSNLNFDDMKIVRLPFLEEKALPLECFDIIVNALKEENPAKTQCIFSSQLGKSRTTLGMAVCCIIKAVQMTGKLDKMVETGIGSREWADQIIHHMFEEPNMDSEDNHDPCLMGEFEVIKELIKTHPEMSDAKTMVDKMIDICGVPPQGTGILNLRKCIIQTKYKYDASSEDRQIVWKKMIINFIERYFFLICFAAYAKEFGQNGFQKSFVQFVNEKAGLKEMIENGKDKLEWERKVDSKAVDDIRSSYNSITDDFAKNFGILLYRVYKISYETYKDIPRGEVKDTLMRKLSCKTLMSILPEDLVENIQTIMVERKVSQDFDSVVATITEIKLGA